MLLATLLCPSLSFAQSPAPAAARKATPAPPVPRIPQASVRSHLEFLAGDALNGRGSGTRDEWIAAAYIGSHLRRLGLEPLGDDGGFVQDVKIERSEIVAPPVLTFDDRRLTHGKEMTVARLGGARISGPLQKYEAGRAVGPGAVLVLPDPSVTVPTAETVPAAIVISLETEQARARRQAGQAPAGRPLTTVQHIVGVPVRATLTVDADSHAALLKAAEGSTITLETEVKAATIAHTWNVLGRLTGTTARSEVILLSAHLDHLGARGANATPGADIIYNGADDDASGSVAVLELAEALVKGRRPRRTILFVWFGSEEAGGFGAGHFIDAPPVPLSSIVANLQFEMIGRGDKAVPPKTLWLTGYERSTLGPALARRGAKIVADPHPQQNFFQRSDNIQLARRGIIAQTVSSFGLHTDYHRPSDEVKTVDIPHMTAAIQSMIRPVLWLANSTYRPSWMPGKQP